MKFPKKTKQQIMKNKLEQLFVKEGKTPAEIAIEMSMPKEAVESLLKFFRLRKSLELIELTENIKEEVDKKRTKEECIAEFWELKRKLHRTPMLLELPKMGKSGLRRDILENWETFSAFLMQNHIGIPRPKGKFPHPENFRRLASEAAIRYRQKGCWSKSEEKIKRILEEDLGLLENLDWWHNFKIKSPGESGSYFQLDFYLPKYHLVIEADSFWHDLGESKARDELRDKWVKLYLDCETIRWDRFRQKGLAALRKILKEKLKGGM